MMEEVPVFFPSIEDMSLPFELYIEKIEEQIAECGICKIIPPPGWKARASGYDNLDDMIIPKPIRQYVTGTRGIFQSVHVESKSLKLSEFKKIAMDPENQPPERYAIDGISGLERAFFKNLTHSPPLYGADGVGSLFDESTKDWNVGSLQTLLSRTLAAHNQTIPGVTTPYLYFGMWGSMFAWHTEDVDLYSINYLHFGQPKSWFTIRPSLRSRFESVLQGLAPHLYKECSQFLRHKETIVSPQLLQKHNIPVTRVLQKEGEFIINFPGVYHSGFNHGFNCAESTNFATSRWVPIGAKAQSCSCDHDSVKIDMSLFGIVSSAAKRQKKPIYESNLMLTREKGQKKVKRKSKLDSMNGMGFNSEPSMLVWVKCQSCLKWRAISKSLFVGAESMMHFVCSSLPNVTCTTPGSFINRGEQEVNAHAHASDSANENSDSETDKDDNYKPRKRQKRGLKKIEKVKVNEKKRKKEKKSEKENDYKVIDNENKINKKEKNAKKEKELNIKNEKMSNNDDEYYYNYSLDDGGDDDDDGDGNGNDRYVSDKWMIFPYPSGENNTSLKIKLIKIHPLPKGHVSNASAVETKEQWDKKEERKEEECVKECTCNLLMPVKNIIWNEDKDKNKEKEKEKDKDEKDEVEDEAKHEVKVDFKIKNKNKEEGKDGVKYEVNNDCEVKKDELKKYGVKKDAVKKDGVKKNGVKKDELKYEFRDGVKYEVKNDCELKKDELKKDELKKNGIKKDGNKKDEIKDEVGNGG